MASPPSSPPRKKRKPRNNAVFTKDTPLWYCHVIESNTFAADQESDILWALAEQEWGGKKDINDAKWIDASADVYRKMTSDTRRIIRCHFFHTSGCPWRAELIKTTGASATGYIRIGNEAHTAHDITSRERGVAGQLRVMVQSPSAFRKRPGQFIAMLRQKGATMTRAMTRQFTRWFSRQKKKAYTTHLQRGEENTYGAVALTFDLFKRDKYGDRFNRHSVYLCGDTYIVDGEETFVAAVLSTENLLLNAYRQCCYGQDVSIFIDTSFRYMYEGWGLMPDRKSVV